MITEDVLLQKGFVLAKSHTGGRRYQRAIEDLVRAAIVVAFDDYYCKLDNLPFCVWLSVDRTDILLAHVRTDEQLGLLWQLVTGEGK